MEVPDHGSDRCYMEFSGDPIGRLNWKGGRQEAARIQGWVPGGTCPSQLDKKSLGFGRGARVTSQALQTKEGAQLTRSLFYEPPGAAVLGRMFRAHPTAPSAPLLQAAFPGAAVLKWGGFAP